MLPAEYREIIEEDRFKQELAQIINEPRRADEFIDGTKWLLTRSPEAGKQIGRSHVWFIPAHPNQSILQVVIYYTFDSDFVNLLSIQETLYPAK